jgi:CheY-like chemotaxis protein
MNLEYKILWFEDEAGSFNAKQRLVKRIVESLGFVFPEPRNEIDGSNLDSINFAMYDLIISDLKLNNVNGTALLEKIREDGIYTEVVFYSSIGETALREELKKFEIDGVYCADRTDDNFIEKVEKVIETTIKKVQDVNNTRGLVIAETILLEKKIESILLKYFDVGEPLLDAKKNELLKSIYEKKVEKHQTDLVELGKINFKEIKILIDKDILTASNSFDAIQSILKTKLKELNVSLSIKDIPAEIIASTEAKIEEIKAIKTELNNFREEILKIRNTLAHVEEEIGEDGISFLNSINSDGTKIKFDNDAYIIIRKNLLKHSSNLEKIIEHIN